MLGYGGTSKPMDAEQYSTKKLSADLAALLDALEIKKAVSNVPVKGAAVHCYRCLLAMIGAHTS